MGWTKIIALNRCAAGKGTFVEAADRELAVFLLEDRVVVIDNACPHASGNLAGGEVKGDVVSCPWHFWEFDLHTGQCMHSPKATVRRYPVELREGEVWALIAE